MYSIDIVQKAECMLAEGPVWDERTGRLFWVDILNSSFHIFQSATCSIQKFTVDQYIGCLVLTTDPDVIYLGLQHGFASFSLSTGTMKRIADPESNKMDNRFNDGKCDPNGRFWAGTMSMNGEKKVGALYTLETDHTISKKINDVSISNGLAWSIDRGTMYFIDTITFQIKAYHYDAETGKISKPTVAVQVPEDAGFPDGMTIDYEGKLWVAHWGGSQVCRWDPITGELMSSIPMPVSQPSSCTFGGDHFDKLFVTSARADLSAEQLEEEALAGSVFVVENIGVKGLKADKFKLNKIN